MSPLAHFTVKTLFDTKEEYELRVNVHGRREWNWNRVVKGYFVKRDLPFLFTVKREMALLFSVIRDSVNRREP